MRKLDLHTPAWVIIPLHADFQHASLGVGGWNITAHLRILPRSAPSIIRTWLRFTGVVAPNRTTIGFAVMFRNLRSAAPRGALPSVLRPLCVRHFTRRQNILQHLGGLRQNTARRRPLIDSLSNDPEPAPTLDQLSRTEVTSGSC